MLAKETDMIMNRFTLEDVMSEVVSFSAECARHSDTIDNGSKLSIPRRGGKGVGTALPPAEVAAAPEAEEKPASLQRLNKPMTFLRSFFASTDNMARTTVTNSNVKSG